MNAWEQFQFTIGLRFADKAAEEQFRGEFAQSVMPIVRGTLLTGVIIMLLLTMRDVQISGVYGTGPVLYRLFVYVPILIVGLGLSFADLPRKHQQIFSFVFATLVILATLGYFTIAPSIEGKPIIQTFRSMSINLLILGVAGLFGLRFHYAVFCGLLAIGVWFIDSLTNALPGDQYLPTYIVFAGTLLLSSGVAYWIERLHREQFAVRHALQEEKARHEQMLFASLPRHAAQRFTAGERPIADAYVDAVVAFADLVGFTDMTKRIGPMETVRVLDQVFTAFDEIMAARGLERVKTMGDGYLFIGGTDVQGGVEEAAGAALEMLTVVNRVAKDIEIPLALRVGMHSGPVIGGVVGKQRPTYDYWGDTLNIANRLEISGRAGWVHCSEAIFWRLEKEWRFEARGPVELDGYGKMQTYLLLGVKRKATEAA